MKRVLSITIAVVLLMGIFTGCGNNVKSDAGTSTSTAAATTQQQPTEKPKETVTITHLSNKAADKDYFDQMFADFEKETGIKVQADFIADKYDVILPTKVAAGDAPDTFQVFPTHTMKGVFGLGKKGLLLDLTNEDFVKGYLDGVLSQISVDGKQYAISTSMNVLPVMYNKKLFTKAGIEKAPTNIKEFMDDCAKLKAANIVPLAAMSKDNGWWMEAFAIAPTTVFGKDPQWQRKREAGQVKYEGDPGWTKTLGIIEELFKKGYIIDKPLTYGYGDAVDVFAKGKTAMFINGNWEFGNIITKGGDGMDLGAFFFPANEPGEQIVWSGSVSEMFAVSANTKHPNEAKALLAYFTKKEADMAKRFNGFPTLKGVTLENPIPAIQELLPVIQNNPSYTFFDNEWPAGFGDYVNKGAQSIISGKLTIEQDLKDADVQFDATWKKAQEDNK